MRKKGYVIFGFIVVLLTGCSSRKDITSLTFSGTLEIEEHSLGAPVSGRIKDILVEEGQGVKAGQPIAFLEHYEQAKRDFERSEALLDSGGVSREQYEHDRQTMDDQQILSPIDGVVLLKVRESGEVVAAGAPVVIMGDPTRLWVKVYIPEDLISQVTVDQQARIRVDGLDKDVPGRVRYIATSAEFTPRNIQTPEERATQTFAVKVSPDNTQISLYPGVAADVYFEQGKVDE